MTVNDQRFSVGVNYWSYRSPAATWRAFDAGEVRDDFAHIAALAAAYPKWQEVQIRFRRAYGASEVKTLTALLGRALRLQA